MENRGGAREGAGRPPSEIIRKSRSLKAFDDEWKLINEFAKLVKHGHRDACEAFLQQINE